MTPTAHADLDKALKKTPQKLKKVKNAVQRLKEEGPSHPGFNTHPMKGLSAGSEKIYISYVENHTPGAWRIHWSWWGPEKIKIIYIGPHT